MKEAIKDKSLNLKQAEKLHPIERQKFLKETFGDLVRTIRRELRKTQR